MKNYLLLSLGLLPIVLTAQNVGINTTVPKTTLEVSAKRESGIIVSNQFVGMQAPRVTREELTNIHGSATYSSDQKGALIYVTDVSGGDDLNERVNVLEEGYYYFDGVIWQRFFGGANKSVYAAKKSTNFGILGLNLTPDFQSLRIDAANDTTVGNPNLINTNGQYVVPASGIYRVKYDFSLAGGVDLSLLSNKRIGIFVNNNLKENKLFDAVRVVANLGIVQLNLAAVPVTSTVIDEYLVLKKGDLLTFAIQKDLDLSLLAGTNVSVNIHKITD